MRTATRKRGKVTVYSPDDRDFKGFLALINQWVEQDSLSYRRQDVEQFCQNWANYSNIRLRTRKEWLDELYNFIHCTLRYEK